MSEGSSRRIRPFKVLGPYGVFRVEDDHLTAICAGPNIFRIPCGSNEKANELFYALAEALDSDEPEAVALRDNAYEPNMAAFLERFVPQVLWPDEEREVDSADWWKRGEAPPEYAG